MENQAIQDLQQTQQSASDLGRSELAALIERHATNDGSHPTAIPSLHFYRTSAPSAPIHSIQEPALCLVAQGNKVVMLGSEAFTYDPEHFLLVSVGLPVAGRIVEASPECPYLGLRLDLDPTLVAALIVTQSNVAMLTAGVTELGETPVLARHEERQWAIHSNTVSTEGHPLLNMWALLSVSQNSTCYPTLV